MKLVYSTPIFSNGLHNAFTSITWFKGAPYIAFRCGSNHIAADGRVMVLRGDIEGEHWLPVAVIWAGIDTRDPKLLVTNEGLFVYAFARWAEPDKVISGYAFSEDGDIWQPWRAVEPDWIYWRPECFGKDCYVAPYGRKGQEGPVVLKHSADGRIWRDVCSLVTDECTSPNETALAMVSDMKMWAIVRRELGNGHPLLGWADSPYTDWHFQELNIKLQGPYLWFAGDTLYVSGRWYQPTGTVCTAIFRIEAGNHAVPQLVLPSGGDTSYMGAVPAAPGEEKRWWLTYYSSHAYPRSGNINPADIYLAEVLLD